MRKRQKKIYTDTTLASYNMFQVNFLLGFENKKRKDYFSSIEASNSFGCPLCNGV